MTEEPFFVTHTSEEIHDLRARGESLTDWDRVRSMTDEEIEANVDEEDEGVFDYSVVYIGIPGISRPLPVQFDQDIVDWFLAKGSGYPRLMNEILRAYIERQKAVSSAAD